MSTQSLIGKQAQIGEFSRQWLALVQVMAPL